MSFIRYTHFVENNLVILNIYMFAKRNILTIVSRINYIILFTLFNTQLTLINKYTQLVKMNIAHQNKSFEIYTDYSGSSSFAQLNCRDSNGAARKDSFRFKIHDGKYFTIPCRKKRLREREREREKARVGWMAFMAWSWNIYRDPRMLATRISGSQQLRVVTIWLWPRFYVKRRFS